MKEKAGNAATLQDNRGVPCNRLPAEPEKSQKRKESVLSKKPTCQEKRGAKSKKMALIQQFTFARDGQDFFAVVVDDGCSFHKKTQICFCAPIQRVTNINVAHGTKLIREVSEVSIHFWDGNFSNFFLIGS